MRDLQPIKMKNVDLLHFTVAHVGEMQSYFHTKKNLTSQLLPRLENQHTLKNPSEQRQ